MITGELKNKVDRVWDAFWSGGISNPLEVIEQITYLLFIRRLDDLNTLAEKKARITGTKEGIIFRPDQQHLRRSKFKHEESALIHKTVADEVFPFLRTLGGDSSTYSVHMKDARLTSRPRSCCRAWWTCSTPSRWATGTPRVYLDGTKFTVEQIRFVNLIVEELTANGVMDPARLYESPYTDHAPTGPDAIFPDADVQGIFDVLRTVKANAAPTSVTA